MNPRQAKWAALLAAFLVFSPIVWFFIAAVADGEERRSTSALRAFFHQGDLAAIGDGGTAQHYLGNSKMAPTFELQDRFGRNWSLKDQRGKVVVLNFWSITCKPCLQEMPTLAELARIVSDRSDIALMTVSIDDGWKAVEGVVPEGLEDKVLFDPEKKVVQGAFGTTLYPETWVVDPEGVVRLRFDGSRDWSSALSLQIIESFL